MDYWFSYCYRCQAPYPKELRRCPHCDGDSVSRETPFCDENAGVPAGTAGLAAEGWMIPLTAFVLAVAFWPGIVSPAMTPRWIALSALAPLCALGIRRARLPGWIAAAGLGWLAWAALSLLWAVSPADGALAWWRWVLLALAFTAGAAADGRTVARALVLFALGASLSGALALVQLWAGVPAAGLWFNPNLMAEAALIGLITCAALRPRDAWDWTLVALLAVAVGGAAWPPACKTVIVGAAGAGLVSLLAHGRRGWAAGAAVSAAAALAAMYFIEPGGAIGSYAIRLAIWRDTLASLSFAGAGIGGFAASYPGFAAHFATPWGAAMTGTALPAVAYNDALQLVFETGPAALAPAAILAFALWRGRHDGAPFYVLAAICALSVVDYPFHTPALGFVGALCAGHLCRRGPRARNLADGRHPAPAGLAGEPVGQRQGVAGAARRGDLAVRPADPRDRGAPGAARPGPAAGGGHAGAARGARPGAGQPGAARQAGAGAAGRGRPDRCARERPRLRPPFSLPAGSPAAA
jgi:hypothetical protein